MQNSTLEGKPLEVFCREPSEHMEAGKKQKPKKRRRTHKKRRSIPAYGMFMRDEGVQYLLGAITVKRSHGKQS